MTRRICEEMSDFGHRELRGNNFLSSRSARAWWLILKLIVAGGAPFRDWSIIIMIMFEVSFGQLAKLIVSFDHIYA